MSSAPAAKTAETVAQAMTPVPLSVASATFMNITVKDWVLMGTAILLTFQLIVIIPKAVRVIRAGLQHITRLKERRKNESK